MVRASAAKTTLAQVRVRSQTSEVGGQTNYLGGWTRNAGYGVRLHQLRRRCLCAVGPRLTPWALSPLFPNGVILDEVQRVPRLFAALKLDIDRRARAGAFCPDGIEQRAASPHTRGLAGGTAADSQASPSRAVRAGV